MAFLKYTCARCGVLTASVYLLPWGGAVCKNRDTCRRRRERRDAAGKGT